MQRGGARMRVNVQLIDAGSGAHLWAERFDKPLADLFDMQDEIVARLAARSTRNLSPLRRDGPNGAETQLDGPLFSGHGLVQQRLDT